MTISLPLPKWLRFALRIACFSVFAATTLTHANLRVADIFMDHMVLQRGKEVPVWGWTEPGKWVRVSFAGQAESTQAGADGRWMVRLQPLEANATGQSLEVEVYEGETATFNDVLVGEVWVAAGQSNMNAGGPDKPTGIYPYYESPDTANAPMRIRHFGFGASLEPVEDFPPTGRGRGAWKELTIGDSTALPEYFTRVVRDGLDVPVGIIRVAFSGTNQAAWMARETLEQFPGDGGDYYTEFLKSKDESLASRPKKTSDGKTIATWDDLMSYQEAWLEEPRGRWPGGGLRSMDFVNWPSALYNTRIHPLAPFAVRGFLWHQGEGGPRGPYGDRLIAMFNQWREVFGQDFYVIWGTLSRFGTDQPPFEPVRKGFYRSDTNIEIRKAYGLADDRMEFVEFYDLGNYDTHFLQKAEAGRRMGLAALDLAYGQDHNYTGPRMAETKVVNGAVFIKFAHTADGIRYEPSLNGISGFVLIDVNQDRRWGQVEVVSPDVVKVAHPELAELALVSYGRYPNPHETIFNSAGLPASPFEVTLAESGRIREPSNSQPVVKTVDKTSARLNLGHVRRDGYQFELLERKGKGDVEVLAYLPEEWPGFVVQQRGQPVTAKRVDIDGVAFVRFAAAINGGPYAVTTPEAAESFRDIHRY